MHKKIITLSLILVILLSGCNKESEKEVVYVQGRSLSGTPYTFLREYNCNDVVEDYWKYPTTYDNAFNYAYEQCNKTYPYIFNITEPEYNFSINGSFFMSNSSKGSFFMSNSSLFSFTKITSDFVIDCSLPEVNNHTMDIVFGEAIYNNTNTIEIPFTEFCRRLKEGEQ